MREDLPQLRESVQALQDKLAEIDPEQKLSVQLRKQGEEMEKLATRIYKNLKRL